MPAIVDSVLDGSIAQELEIQKGDELVSVDGQVLSDMIDYNFYMKSEDITILIKHKNGEEEAQMKKKEAEQRRSKVESRIKELDNIIRCLFEEMATGRMTQERYDKLASGYEKEQRELETELAELSMELNDMDKRDTEVRRFIEKAKTNIEMREVTPEILKAFVTRIDVYEKPEKYSRTCGNMIEIHYTVPSINKLEST